jgi:hypothetical protein
MLRRCKDGGDCAQVDHAKQRRSTALASTLARAFTPARPLAIVFTGALAFVLMLAPSFTVTLTTSFTLAVALRDAS